MVIRCVKPACRNELRFLNAGNLYALERRSADTEFFWLCSACVPLVVLSLDPRGCISVIPQSDAVSPQPPHPDAYLRLVAQSKFTYTMAPWHHAREPSQSDLNALRFLHRARPHKPRQSQDTYRRV